MNIDKQQIQKMHEDRKKFDRLLSQLFPNDIHLHDISQNSQQNSLNDDLKIITPSSQKPKPITAKRSYDQDYFSKSYRESPKHPSFHNSNTLSNQKKKAQYWQQIRKFIKSSVSKKVQMNSLQDDDDKTLLIQFIEIVQSLIEAANERINSSKKILGLKQELKDVEKKNYLMQGQLKQFQDENKILRKLRDNYRGEEKEIKERLMEVDAYLKQKQGENRLIREKSRVELEEIKRYMKVKDEDMNDLVEQNRKLKVQLSSERDISKKMKKIIAVAKDLIDSFQRKFTKISQQPKVKINSEYFSMVKKEHHQNKALHLRNNRLGIVKSRSLMKESSAGRDRRKNSELYSYD